MRLNIEKTALLKNSDFFNKTPEENLFDLAAKSQCLLLNAGETLVFAKTIPDAIFVIVSGGIEIHRDDGSTKSLGKNDVLVFLETLQAKETLFFAVASEETEVLKINKNDLLLEINSNPDLALGLITALCAKVY